MTEVITREETLDILCDDKLRIIQTKDGYRFSIDAVLLANFVTLKKHERLLDVGSGCGIIPIYITRKGFANEMVGVEIQEDLYNVSLRNKTLNHCTNIEFLLGDIITLKETLKTSLFHVVISNPPYTRELTGRKSPCRSRLMARHETSLALDDLVSVAFSLLYKRGRFYVIYPARRLGELISVARSRKLELKRLRLVHPKESEKANLVLAAFIKEGGVGATVEQPLYIYDKSSYTDEVKGYYCLQG